ncbi:MAG: cell filamentation protein Fic [Planctomycetes bacterium GWC2_45_44]|nr:MAG: cell filamentation protein Fic [Planctomycetes bacterium GWC2_45_44]HBR19409.1 Fic family protein [Phycisphaerales bacterium]
MHRKSKSLWNPLYSISPAIVRGLMEIEAAKAVVENTPLTPAVETELRYKARVRSTHYSTRIEGNRLTLKEAQDVIEKKKTNLHGRQRDVKEVRNYWDALLKVEDWAARKVDFSEDLIRRLHAIVEKGLRSKPTAYRDGQNVIRDSQSGGIVYMPPEAKDVSLLMTAMVRWVRKAEKENIPVPVIAALVHYQFVTIHPYYDGNGRTARLLATFILQRGGYGLHGFFSMEEHHARDLASYYKSLVVHQHHNYYYGRAEAELTGWVEYFISLLARVFTQAKDEALRLGKTGIPSEPEKLRRLDHRARVVLAIFAKKDTITAKDAAEGLGLSNRMMRILMQQWAEDGWLTIVNMSNRSRSYGLSANYRQFVGNVTEK